MHVHDMRTAYARRIVQTRVVITTGFQLGQCARSASVFITASLEPVIAGWTGLHAGRFCPTVSGRRTAYIYRRGCSLR